MSSVPSHQPGHLHFKLNSDGQSHKLLNVASVLVLLIGVASFTLGIFIRNDSAIGGVVGWAAITTSMGLIAMVGGLWAQLVSATTEERILIVTGIIAGFVGFAVGLAHGGFGG
jgi:uncharacterized membrane protein